MQKHMTAKIKETKTKKMPTSKLHTKMHTIKKKIEEEWIDPLAATLEDEDEIIIRMDLPDINEEDIQIGFTKDALVVKGEVRMLDFNPEFSGNHMKRHKLKFHKEIPLPQRVNPKDAVIKLEDGLLEVRMPLEKEAIESDKLAA